MFLFRSSSMVTPIYQDKRKVMVAWMDNVCDCGLTSAGQVLNDIEKHEGGNGDGGITSLRATAMGFGTNLPVFHHSAGKIGTGKTCSAFWVVAQNSDLAKMVLLGQHQTNTTYFIEWMAPTFTFTNTGAGGLPKVGATINPF